MILGLKISLRLELLGKFLLLYGGLHLILVFQGISPHFFLSLYALLVPRPLVLSHLLFLLHLLLVLLEFQLNLVLSPALAHVCLVLDSFPPLFLCHLSPQ